MDLPLALPWKHAISYLDMPGGLQHPHTNTHTQQLQHFSLVRHKAEVTLTRLPPKPSALRPLAALLILSFGQKKKHELSLWLFPIMPAGEPTELLPVHTVFCDILWSLLPPTTTTTALPPAWQTRNDHPGNWLYNEKG